MMKFNNTSGLINNSNTCYLNSALQIIANNEILCPLLIGDVERTISQLVRNIPKIFDDATFQKFGSLIPNHLKDKIKVEPFVRNMNIREIVLFLRCTITYRLVRLLQNMKSQSINNPKEFYEIFLLKNTHFTRGQNDSNEALIAILTNLEDELLELFPQSLKGQKASHIICTNTACNYQRIIMEDFFFIELHITECTNLEHCLENYFDFELMDNDNRWKCEKCNYHVRPLKKYSIRKLPKYLFISLKRFNKTNHANPFKVSYLVDFPMNFLNMNRYGRLNEPFYYLQSVIYHSGGLHNGHYVSYNKVANNWLLFDDSHVSKVEGNDVVNAGAYLLVYKN